MAYEEKGWVEINVAPNKEPYHDQLRNVVDPLVHVGFAGEFETWHFFCEPQGIRLRFRWRDLARQTEVEERLETTLGRWQRDGRFKTGWFGNHGTPGERHEGEAEAYGPEVWDLIQKDWEVSSELAVRFVLVGEAGLTGAEHRTFQRHWERHVHGHTNRQFLSLEAEITLSMLQARGYLGNLIQASGGARKAWLNEVAAHMGEALARWNWGQAP